MKARVGIVGLMALAVALAGCKDDAVSAGADAVLNGDEDVRVCAATFGDILSQTDTLADFAITQTPDSFLVGECNTQEWKTIQADLMTQFACPEGFVFPDSSEIDSVALMMTYNSWFGDGDAPLRLSVYELDRGTFDYNKTYSSQEPLDLYWSGLDSTHFVVSDRTIVASQPTDSVYSSEQSRYMPYVRFKVNDRFVRKMNTLKRFPRQNAFNEFFKGVYIKSTFGASTALYLSNITLVISYHYFYETAPNSGEYKKQNDNKYLYANSEVRQVNRYAFPDKKAALDSMQMQYGDTLNFVVSPGYVYTVLTFPMQQYLDTIYSRMQTDKGALQSYINKASMRVDVTNGDVDGTTYNHWANPAENMLLIHKDSVNNFFQHNRLPSSEYCLLGTLNKVMDSQMHYHYYYAFDLSTMLQMELRKQTHSENVQMVMVPVHVEYSSSSSSTAVSKVTINQTITSTIIRSAQHATDPMNIDALFTGFTIHTIR
ncbi:MAG: DUF4270 domain-containing protein [Paludibacteraceae bacterium]|nr:DUF4270 domain-containing protein [Paludibacteraceae bacterium]